MSPPLRIWPPAHLWRRVFGLYARRALCSFCAFCAFCAGCAAPQRDATDATSGRQPPAPSARNERRHSELSPRPSTAVERHALHHAALDRCRASLDAHREDADLQARYQHQGRISDAGLRRALQLAALTGERIIALRACWHAAGVEASAASLAALPNLQSATAALFAHMRESAEVYRLEPSLQRGGAALALRTRLEALGLAERRAVLWPIDGLGAAFEPAAAAFVVLDVAVAPPGPTPLLDAKGRLVGRETPLIVVVGPLPSPLTGLCLHRYVLERSAPRGASTLVTLPQSRVAACPRKP